jgi:hypothetical protein
MLKRKLLIVITIVAGVGFLTGCANKENYTPTPTNTNLEFQSIQKQEFSVRYKIAFLSTLSAFQNKGYSIESSNADTGVITAIKHKRSAMLFSGRMLEYIKATAFVEKTHFGKLFISLNLANYQETARMYGAKDGNLDLIRDPKFYQAMFESIREAVSARVSK